MVLKTFNLDEEVYKKFADFCKEHGLSMSKQINIFIETQIEEDPEVKESYLRKLQKISKGKFIKVDDFSKRYEL